jgi:hypothetical protein
MTKKTIFKNKKAVMSILEAFIAISLIIVIVILLIEQNASKEEDIQERVYLLERGILRSLQINETYRADILGAAVPVYWNDNSFPIRIKEKITIKKPSYLNCKAKICAINQPCPMGEDIEQNVYSQSAFISANATTYSPRELKIFCWEIE